MTRHLLFWTAFLTLSAVSSFGQTDTTTKTKKNEFYEYEVCVYKGEKSGRVIKNQRTAIADTTIAFVSGQIIDINKEVVSFANIELTSKTNGQKYWTQGDASGKYSLQVPADNYLFRVASAGYPAFSLDSLEFGTGDRREVDIDLGQGGTFTTYSVKSKKRLTARQLKKKAAELKAE